MRTLPEEKSFAKFLLKVGNGDLQNEEEAYIKVPRDVFSQNNLINDVLGDCIRDKNFAELANRAILCTTNEACRAINDTVLELIDGETVVYYSRDKIDGGGPASAIHYPDEFMHGLEASGLPPHELKVKYNVPLMLLRNLNVSQGLTNGTRLLLKVAKPSVLICEIITGSKAGEIAFIPRVKCINNDGTFPFTLSREQFPVRLSYSLTVNKSQGSTFNKIGLNFEKEPFSHGQTYTAMSRVRSWDGLRIQVTQQARLYSVKSIVWRDALLNSVNMRVLIGQGCVPGDTNIEQSDADSADDDTPLDARSQNDPSLSSERFRD